MYQEPKRLPPPFDLPAPSVLPVYGLALLAVICLGTALFYVAKLGYVFVIYNIVLGLGLGHALSIGLQWGRYPLSVNRVAILSSILLYAGFHLGLYLESVAALSGSRPGFIDFMLYRAEQQQLVFGYQPGPFAIGALWIGEIGLTIYIALRTANRTLARVRLNSVPTEVTEFVLYLLFQGKGAADIEAELAEHGWTERQDVVRALDAADVAASLIRTSRTRNTETADDASSG